jgi:hypothetical protein
MPPPFKPVVRRGVPIGGESEDAGHEPNRSFCTLQVDVMDCEKRKPYNAGLDAPLTHGQPHRDRRAFLTPPRRGYYRVGDMFKGEIPWETPRHGPCSA